MTPATDPAPRRRAPGHAALLALASLGAALLLAACGEGPAAPPQLAGDEGVAAAPPLSPASTPTPPLVVPTPPLAAPTPPAQAPVPPPDPTAAAAATYRAWMEEARVLHPYGERVEKMWAVMLCESSGDAGVVAGLYHGLFQYSPATWGGAWNPYRDQPILDPRAQIFATAKAWQDGYQSWWGCY